MSQAAIAHAPAPQRDPTPSPPREASHVWHIEGATWADFQRLLELRGEHPVPRFAYLEGRLEIMSPSRSHEHIKTMIGRLVEAWCAERGLDHELLLRFVDSLSVTKAVREFRAALSG